MAQERLTRFWTTPIFYVVERYEKHGARILNILSGPIEGHAQALARMEEWRKFVPEGHELTVADIRFRSDVVTVEEED